MSSGRGLVSRYAGFWRQIAILAAAIGLAAPLGAAGESNGNNPARHAGIGRAAQMAAVRVPFIVNEGQAADPSVRFYAKTFAGTVGVTAEGEIVYALPGERRQEESGFTVQGSRFRKRGEGEEKGEAPRGTGVSPVIPRLESKRWSARRTQETPLNHCRSPRAANWWSTPREWRCEVPLQHGVWSE